MTEPINFDFVADLYDSYVTANLDLQFFLNETSEFDDEILELMCGTGRVSIPLLESGKKLCCVDYSKKMLDVFRSKIIGKDYPVSLIRMDVTKLDLEIINTYGDYSKNDFIEQTSNFLIYKLKKQSTKA